MCEAIRHGRVNLRRDQGASFGKSSTGWFFGFKLDVVTTLKAEIIAAVLTNGNIGDREGARLLAGHLEEGSLCLADLGYRGDDFQDEYKPPDRTFKRLILAYFDHPIKQYF
jgi:hypothetical protein